MSSGWFNSLGWWRQEEAYTAFDHYRSFPTTSNFEDAVNKALPIIRVVYSAQKFKSAYKGDEDDLISHAALTITKALPKMILKPVEKLDNDKKYMRYLFTCVSNAFYREYDVLHGKHNKLQRKLNEHREPVSTYKPATNVQALEAQLTLDRLPGLLYGIAMECVRFEGVERKICSYMLNQMIAGRETAKSVLQIMGCTHRDFFDKYCDTVLLRAFFILRQRKPAITEASFEGSYEEGELENFDLNDFLGSAVVS